MIVPDQGAPVIFPGAGGGIQPDEGAPIQMPGEAPAPEAPGVGESLARGAFQGVTFGFGDELSGLVRSLVNGTSYQAERDAARQANAQAKEANPWSYGGAELAGGLATPIPGLGAGGGIAKAALHGAIAGGVAGLGSSEADLTTGDNAGFAQAATDTISNALLGGAIGAAGGKLGKMLHGAPEKAEEQTIKALAGGESKTSGAAWQKTKRMVNNPETRAILQEPVTVENEAGKATTTTLQKVAGKEPDAIADVVDAQTKRINEEIRPIYAKADAKNGGVSLKDYIDHLDEQIAKLSEKSPAEARVYKGAINELKENAIEHWGGGAKAFELSPGQASANPETNAALRDVIMKQGMADIRIPSEDVRAEATALQKIGFKTVDPLNPGLSTQVKRDMGNMVRDFVNDHVMRTLGDEDHSRLLSLNKRMNAWLGVGSVAAARAEKEAAGRMSARGGVAHMLGHGTMAAGILGAAMGHPAALLAPLGAKALEHAPAAARGATRGAAAVETRLKAVADAAAGGNPWAQKLIASIRQTPEGAARLAALERNQGSPAPPPEPEVSPDATLAQQ